MSHIKMLPLHRRQCDKPAFAARVFKYVTTAIYIRCKLRKFKIRRHFVGPDDNVFAGHC